MYAQALAEYGLLAAMITAVQQAWSTVTDIVTTPDSRLIYIVGSAALAWMSVRMFRK